MIKKKSNKYFKIFFTVMTVLQNLSFTEALDLVLYAPLTLTIKHFAADIRV